MRHQTWSPATCGGSQALIRDGGEQGVTGGFSEPLTSEQSGFTSFLARSQRAWRQQCPKTSESM